MAYKAVGDSAFLRQRAALQFAYMPVFNSLKSAVSPQAPASEFEALLYLSQQAPRARVRRWLQQAGSARAAFAQHGAAPIWPLDAIEAASIRVTTSVDSTYPEALRHIPDPPLALYYQGDLPAADDPCVAIVGARSATRLGLQIAQSMGRQLAAAGVTVGSGLARGIDAAAHQGALAEDVTGRAWAILGSGLLKIYPRQHCMLADRIIASGGALITEYIPNARPQRYYFPERNRLISGLAKAVVVVEASQRSGSLITARMAAEQGRDVFAVPGAVSSPVSSGCHWLIRQGAGLVENAHDVLEAMGYAVHWSAASEQPEPPPSRLAPVFNAVTATSTPADEVATVAGVSVEAAAGDLVQLEMLGFVQFTPDGYIRALRQ